MYKCRHICRRVKSTGCFTSQNTPQITVTDINNKELLEIMHHILQYKETKRTPS